MTARRWTGPPNVSRADLQRFQPVKVEIGGRAYNATWHIEGQDLVVSSAYGSKAAPAGRGKPEALAQKLLREIVAARA